MDFDEKVAALRESGLGSLELRDYARVLKFLIGDLP
jgi:hypothetical protein